MHFADPVRTRHRVRKEIQARPAWAALSLKPRASLGPYKALYSRNIVHSAPSPVTASAGAAAAHVEEVLIESFDLWDQYERQVGGEG